MKFIRMLLISIAIFSQAVFASDFNFEVCDKKISNRLYVACYSYKYNGVIYGKTILPGNLVYKNNIKKRPRYKSVADLPYQHRVRFSDYYNIGRNFNKGHTIISDASADYDMDTLKLAYLFVNITPQNAVANKYYWGSVEEFGRQLATQYSGIVSETYVTYGNKKYKKMTIPERYYRRYSNGPSNIEYCFSVPNRRLNTRKTLDDFRIDCSEMPNF